MLNDDWSLIAFVPFLWALERVGQLLKSQVTTPIKDIDLFGSVSAMVVGWTAVIDIKHSTSMCECFAQVPVGLFRFSSKSTSRSNTEPRQTKENLACRRAFTLKTPTFTTLYPAARGK